MASAMPTTAVMPWPARMFAAASPTSLSAPEPPMIPSIEDSVSVSPAARVSVTVPIEDLVYRGRDALDWILETGATYVMGVPTHAIDILEAARRRGTHGLGRVKVFYMGGAAIPRETAHALMAMGITPQ
mgnify:CR=1 FL=1